MSLVGWGSFEVARSLQVSGISKFFDLECWMLDEILEFSFSMLFSVDVAWGDRFRVEAIVRIHKVIGISEAVVCRFKRVYYR